MHICLLPYHFLEIHLIFKLYILPFFLPHSKHAFILSYLTFVVSKRLMKMTSFFNLRFFSSMYDSCFLMYPSRNATYRRKNMRESTHLLFLAGKVHQWKKETSMSRWLSFYLTPNTKKRVAMKVSVSMTKTLTFWLLPGLFRASGVCILYKGQSLVTNQFVATLL